MDCGLRTRPQLQSTPQTAGPALVEQSVGKSHQRLVIARRLSIAATLHVRSCVRRFSPLDRSNVVHNADAEKKIVWRYVQVMMRVC